MEKIIPVERLEAFEERLGITLEGVTAKFYLHEDGGNWMYVLGEVYPIDGTKINKNIEIIATAHDDSGRVLYKSDTRVEAESFYGFEAFEIVIPNAYLQVSKIRVYPKIES